MLKETNKEPKKLNMTAGELANQVKKLLLFAVNENE